MHSRSGMDKLVLKSCISTHDVMIVILSHDKYISFNISIISIWHVCMHWTKSNGNTTGNPHNANYVCELAWCIVDNNQSLLMVKFPFMLLPLKLDSEILQHSINCNHFI